MGEKQKKEMKKIRRIPEGETIEERKRLDIVLINSLIDGERRRG